MDHANEQVTGRATGNGTGLTVAETAYRLGISERAVRARIRRGTLHAAKTAGRHGAVWSVTLPGNGQTGTEARPDGEPAPATWSVERAALLDQVAWLRNQVDNLTRIVEADRNERAALNARPLAALPSVDSDRRPWWRFW